MRQLVYYIAVTIDGRIAGPDGEFDFYPVGDADQAARYTAWINTRYPETVPTGMRAAHGLTDTPNKAFDTLVMGAGTYRTVLDAGITSPYAHLRQYALSSTLDTDPDVTVVAGDPLTLVRDLKKQEGKDIWLCGGGRLAGVLLPEIDRLVIKSYPVVAGAGVSVFDGDLSPTPFAVTERESFDNGVVVTHFTRR